MQGVQEMVAVKVRVFRENGDTLTFGVYTGGMNHRMDGDTAPLLTLQVSRQINRPGVAAFALPGLSELQTGQPWSSLINLGDYVQIDATVQRAPGPQDNSKGYSHTWRTLFLGRVLDIEDADFQEGDGFVYSTMVTCDDFLGSLESPQFTYWLKLGDSFGDSGQLKEILNRLDKVNLTAKDIPAAGVSVAASFVLTAMIEGRLDIVRQIGKKEVPLKDTYGYRFEGDDLAVHLELKQLAPEAQTWKAALQSMVDGPHFYELFQDSLPRGAANKKLAPTDNGEVGRSNAGQFRSRAPSYTGAGDYGELLVVRPAPFPTFRDEVDSAGKATGKTFYSQAAWDALPIIEAAPFAHSNLKVSKSRKELFSAFAANILPSSFGNNTQTQDASQSMQMVADLHKMLHVTGYVPLDVGTIRSPNRTVGSKSPPLGPPQLTRILSYQLFSFNQLNDLYLNGSSEIPVDLRLQLGVRWREADQLFYIEGYKHVFTPEGANSSLTLSRGLPVEYYGLEPKRRPKMADKMNYVKKYLGRQRPEDRLAPKAGRPIMDAMNDDQKAQG